MKIVLIDQRSVRGRHRDVYRRPAAKVLTDITKYSSKIVRLTEYEGDISYVQYDPSKENNGITNLIENHKLLFFPGAV